MAITPRADEWKPVLELIDSDEFDMENNFSKEAPRLAKAIVKRVAEELSMREWYVLRVAPAGGGKGLSYGPYSSDKDAIRDAERIGDSEFEYRIIPIHPSGVLDANLGGRKKGGHGYCSTDGCGHPSWLHYINGTSRGKCAECDCQKMKK